TQHRVERDVGPEEPSVEAGQPIPSEEEHEKRDPRPGEVELRGLERLVGEDEVRIGARREPDRPRKVRGQAEAATAQKTTEPPDPDPEGHARRGGVAHAPDGKTRPPDVEDPSRDREEVPPIEHQPAFPNPEYPAEVAPVIAPVGEHVEPAPPDDREDEQQQGKGAQLVLGEAALGAALQEELDSDEEG